MVTFVPAITSPTSLTSLTSPPSLASPTSPTFLGIDVSKASLDVHFSDGRAALGKLDNRGVSIKRFVAQLSKNPPVLTALEATGGYENAALPAPLDARGRGVPVN